MPSKGWENDRCTSMWSFPHITSRDCMAGIPSGLSSGQMSLLLPTLFKPTTCAFNEYVFFYTFNSLWPLASSLNRDCPCKCSFVNVRSGRIPTTSLKNCWREIRFGGKMVWVEKKLISWTTRDEVKFCEMQCVFFSVCRVSRYWNDIYITRIESLL